MSILNKYAQVPLFPIVMLVRVYNICTYSIAFVYGI